MRGGMLFNSRLACSMVGVLSELLGETIIYLVDQKHENFAHWLSLLKNFFFYYFNLETFRNYHQKIFHWTNY